MASIGARIWSDGHYGTIKFIGAVPPTEGEWLGIDWDNPKRGKHDGTKDSVRYFTATHPTSGSFLRPKKVSFGQDFLSAVVERYGAIEDDNAGVILEDMYVYGKNQKTTVEVVGAKSVNIHQSQFGEIQEVALRGLPISRAGPEGKIHSVMPKVKDLDVSDTLLASWTELAKITSQLPLLETLKVSDNLLAYKEEDDISQAFLNVKVLSANRCRMTWNDVRRLSAVLPSVETIHVCFNNICDISVSENDFKKLTFLNLEGNQIGKWEHILQLYPLQSLETLILNNIDIDKIEFPDVKFGKTKHLPKLKALSIFHNKISEWSSIDELNKLVSFEDLKIRFNPLTQDNIYNEETVRSLLIAKIGQLKTCSRSQVTVEERQGAELDYLRMFGKEWRAAGGHQDPAKNKPSEEFTLKHPRYQACIDAHGPCEDTELVVKSSALKNNLLNLTIECPLRPNIAPLKKAFPSTMTVQKLKALVQRVFKGNAATLTLSYSTPKHPNREFELENDMRDIGHFAVADGDRIIVKWN